MQGLSGLLSLGSRDYGVWGSGFGVFGSGLEV